MGWIARMFCAVVQPECTKYPAPINRNPPNKCLIFAKSLFVYVQERDT